jgi:hypothetical protein
MPTSPAEPSTITLIKERESGEEMPAGEEVPGRLGVNTVRMIWAYEPRRMGVQEPVKSYDCKPRMAGTNARGRPWP